MRDLRFEGFGVVAQGAPVASLCIRADQAWLREGAQGAWTSTVGDPWALVRAFVAEPRGGIALLASYDAGRLIEKVPERARDDTRLPWLLLHKFDERGVGGGGGEGAVVAPARSAAPPPSPPPAPRLEQRTSPKEFESMVLAAQERIRAGDVFQANLSHRLECATSVPPRELYARLCAANPAPFAAYFESGPLPDGLSPFHVLSSSPELLFSLRDGVLEARPIAGTRPRSADAARDAALAAELRSDGKERAEHVMLVDLARNDLGRVAAFGSVRVPRLLDVESYRTVHHLVSTVQAQLAPGKDVVDAFCALFPGGTITGAPKVRSMEIIEELEPVRRGVYTGSLGWIAPDGSAVLNILIRTLLVKDGRVHVQVGAGIVEESVPEREYRETLAKAEGMLRALGVSS